MSGNRKPATGGDRCPPPEAIVGAILGDTSDADAADVLIHADRCVSCRAFVRDIRATVDTLKRTAEPPSAGRDLTPGVLARLPADAWSAGRAERPRAAAWWRVRHAWTPLRIAAAALAVAGIGLVARRLTPPEGAAARPAAESAADAAVDRGVDWLLTRQSASGGWNVADLGGKPEYASALNGLAVLALARADGPGPAVRDALERALDALLLDQAANGRFGGDFDGVMYNHGIATLALLEGYSVTHGDNLRDGIARALTFMCERQATPGGWGYRDTADALPNTSITAWQVQALLLADRLGWRAHRTPLRRALAWLSGTVNGQGFFGYERTQDFPEGPNTLTMMGAYCLLAAQNLDIRMNPKLAETVMHGIRELAGDKPGDYYGAFFHASALNAANPASFRGDLKAARTALVARQRTRGDDAGTWSADDRWGAAGGRIYSTSMALLSLTPSRTDDKPL